MILIVDMNWKQDSLAFSEFVSPIVSVVQPIEDCAVKHFLNVEPEEIRGYSKIVLSGNSLKDQNNLTKIMNFGWIKTCQRPILGICAGMQTISLVFGGRLTKCLQVGMTEIRTIKENQLFSGNFNAYTLHNYSVIPPKTFDTLAESSKCIQAIKHREKTIFGLLFHPEVRNIEILETFAKS
jgi:GMP synthase-like glutamine amidotransferase